MYLITAVGVTVGFHRLLTHRAFQTYPWLERVFAVMGSLSVQGSVMDWVADHRKHHAHADKEGDPHSPHVGHGQRLAGLWHAHTGWLLETQGQADWKRYAAELYEDPRMRRHRPALPVAGAGLAADPDGCRATSSRLHLGGRAARVHLGRPRADLPRAPRDLVGELDLPLLRPPPLRHRGPVDERGLAVAAVARRVLAPQPPRVPALRVPRPQAMGDRPVGPADLRHWSASGLAWNVVRITPERQLEKAGIQVPAQ